MSPSVKCAAKPNRHLCGTHSYTTWKGLATTVCAVTPKPPTNLHSTMVQFGNTPNPEAHDPKSSPCLPPLAPRPQVFSMECGRGKNLSHNCCGPHHTPWTTSRLYAQWSRKVLFVYDYDLRLAGVEGQHEGLVRALWREHCGGNHGYMHAATFHTKDRRNVQLVSSTS